MFRVGLYARVSTEDQNTLAMQNRAMREFAVRRGWTVVMQVREVNSGAVRRQAREKLLEAARRREIDGVLVWRLDRWGRSVTDLLATLQELDHLGVGFVSLTEALDLTVIFHDLSPWANHIVIGDQSRSFPPLRKRWGTARSGQGRAVVERRSEPLTARTVPDDWRGGKDREKSRARIRLDHR